MTSLDKPDNLVELQEESVDRFGDRPWFGVPDEQGEYSWVTYREVGRRIDALRGGLAQQGIGRGDAVGVIVNNQVEWAIAAFATFGLGGRFIPMYEKELAKVWEHIIWDSGVKVLFVANPDILEQVRIFRSGVPDLEKVYVIKGRAEETMAQLEQTGRQNPVPSLRPKPDDIAVLIYTSGTTGNPKGVLLSHGNFTSNVIAGSQVIPQLSNESRSLSILPWAHSYSQTAELYSFTRAGASIGLIREASTIAEDMPKVSPTVLIAVPRVFNTVYDGVWNKMNATGGIAKKLFVMGLKSAARCRSSKNSGSSVFWPKLKLKLADRIVFSKIRERFGGRLEMAMTASAMMNPDVAQFFWDIGLPVYDCYGLTETSPAVSMNGPLAHKAGSVGRPIDKVQVVIDKDEAEGSDEGEIVVYGPNVMQGYHNNPEATADVMTEDGGFRTGDIGRLDEEGFLFITGRIKEQYKLENGKYVFPATLEEEIQLVPWVANVFVYGEGRRHNICLVVPDFARLEPWVQSQGLPVASGELIRHPQVHTMIEQSISDHLQGKFGGYEMPRRFIFIEEPFTVENGLLTQTLKLKRRKVAERYADKIEAAYGS